MIARRSFVIMALLSGTFCAICIHCAFFCWLRGRLVPSDRGRAWLQYPTKVAITLVQPSSVSPSGTGTYEGSYEEASLIVRHAWRYTVTRRAMLTTL